jgi:hypothetical protein
VEVKDGIGNLYSKSINKWENVELEGDRDFVKLTETMSFAYDGDSDHRETGTTYAYDDETGNFTEQVEYGEVTGSDNGSFTDTGRISGRRPSPMLRARRLTSSGFQPVS